MFRSIWLFVAVFAFSLCAAGAYAADGKPLTDADKAEGQGLLDNYVTPIMNDMRTAINLASTDQPKACALIQTVEQRAAELQSRIKTLQNRLIAEGKTTNGIDKMVTGSAEIVEGSHSTAVGICGGALAKTGNPEEDALKNKFVRLMGSFTDGMNGYTNSEKLHDHTAACAHLKDANSAFNDLYALLLEVRSKIPDGTADAAQADAVLAKVSSWKPTLTLYQQACPAG